MALEIARTYNIPIEVVDPNPAHILHPNVSYKKMTALEYIQKF
jgi:NAD-dependent deacetylase